MPRWNRRLSSRNRYRSRRRSRYRKIRPRRRGQNLSSCPCPCRNHRGKTRRPRGFSSAPATITSKAITRCAIILLKQYLRQHPRSAQAGDAQYWIGEALYQQKEFNAAIVAFDEVIQEYPQNEMVAASTLKVGLSFANLGDQPNARFFLQQVQENFPNSAEAQLATEKLKQLRR